MYAYWMIYYETAIEQIELFGLFHSNVESQLRMRYLYENAIAYITYIIFHSLSAGLPINNIKDHGFELNTHISSI